MRPCSDGAYAEAEEVLDLCRSDEDGDAVGESDYDGTGDEPDGRTKPGEPHCQQNDAGHQGDHCQAGKTEAGNDAGDDHDESASGSADLGAGTAERRDEEARDDGGIEASLRSNSGGDAEGHGERQRNESDSDADEEVVQKHLPVVLA